MAPFYEENISFRTWAHVEWGQQDEIYKILEEFENEADRLVTAQELCLVCAYDAERIPNSLKTSLMKCHKFLIKGDEILNSDVYSRKD